MSNRSLWPEGCEVHQRHLQNETTERISATNQLIGDTTSKGVVSGLSVTINGGDNTKVDISSGYGYAPNGEYVELGTSQTAIALAGITFGYVNYILLMYDEVNSSPEAHETDGTTRYTKATVSPRVVVLSAAQYTAMAATDAVLSNNAKDRALLVAIVTGTGGALTTSAIQQSTTFNAVLQSNQPNNITGVLITNIDPNTSTGSGTLSYEYTPQRIRWQAPGEGSPGSWTTLTTSGQYTVTSSGARTLTLNITASTLPLTNQSDTITIANVYGQTIPHFTAIDSHHRSLTGSGVPSTTNPHGMTIEDLSPGASGTLEGHQDVEHANGLVRTSASTLLSATVNTGPAPDTLSLINFASGDIAYVNGKRIEALTSSTTITFGDGIVEPCTYTVYLGQDGNLFKQILAKFPNTGTSLLYNKVQILDVVNVNAGTYNLTWNSAGWLQWDSGPTMTAPTVDHVVRCYNSARTGYVELFVKGASTPGTTQTDSIVISSLAAAEENIPLVNVPWTGSATGFLGYGFGLASLPNKTYDKRQWGTLSEVETRLDDGMVNTSLMISEVLGDGILVRANPLHSATTNNQVTIFNATNDQVTLGTLAFPSIAVTGGVVYIGGRRKEVATTTLTVANNSSNQIYIDADGTIVTTTASWADILAAQYGRPILRLYELVITASAETSRTDLRDYVGHKRNYGMGVVSYDKFKQVQIATESNASVLAPALYVVNNSASGGGTGVQGVGAISSGTNDALGGAFWARGTGNNHGLWAQATGTYAGVRGVSGQTTIGSGVQGTGYPGTNSHGVVGDADGTGAGVYGVGGTNNTATTGPFSTVVSGTTLWWPGPGTGTVGIGSTGTGGGDGVQGFGRGSGRTGVLGYGANTPTGYAEVGGQGGYFEGGIPRTSTSTQQNGKDGGTGVRGQGNIGSDSSTPTANGLIGGSGGWGGYFIGGKGGTTQSSVYTSTAGIGGRGVTGVGGQGGDTASLGGSPTAGGDGVFGQGGTGSTNSVGIGGAGGAGTVGVGGTGGTGATGPQQGIGGPGGYFVGGQGTTTSGGSQGLLAFGYGAATTLSFDSDSAGVAAKGGADAHGVVGYGNLTGDGILGIGSSTAGSYGVRGVATGTNDGIYGTGGGVQGVGVLGVGGGTVSGNSNSGVYGIGNASGSPGVLGYAFGSAGTGVLGTGNSTVKYAVHGYINLSSGTGQHEGIRGEIVGTTTSGADCAGVHALGSATGDGAYGIICQAVDSGRAPLRLVPVAATPTGLQSGDIWYHSGTNTLWYFNGTSNKQIATV